MEEENKDILEQAIEAEFENGSELENGSEAKTKSNKVVAELYRAKGEILKAQVDSELEMEKLETEKTIRLAEIEAEERRDKRQTRQRYVNTACMVGVGVLAMFADSDSFIGRINNKVFGLAAKLIFKS